MDKMNVLVACEESQEVCKAFRERGHNAYSCDLQPCSGGHPEWHIQSDVTKILNAEDHGNNCMEIWFDTCDGKTHFIKHWDLIIAHPPCTYLSNAGACNPYRKWATSEYREEYFNNRNKAYRFVMTIANADCEKIAIENPIGYLNTHWRKPDQIIHPYEYGHSVNKPTCLWIKGLPLLHATNIVEKDIVITWSNGKKISKWYKDTLREAKDRAELSKIRSKTFHGIAAAMAEQWG